MRYNLLAKYIVIKDINQYPLFRKKNQHIILTAKNFINKSLNEDIESDPKILIEKSEIENAKKQFGFNCVLWISHQENS